MGFIYPLIRTPLWFSYRCSDNGGPTVLRVHFALWNQIFCKLTMGFHGPCSKYRCYCIYTTRNRNHHWFLLNVQLEVLLPVFCISLPEMYSISNSCTDTGIQLALHPKCDVPMTLYHIAEPLHQCILHKYVKSLNLNIVSSFGGYKCLLFQEVVNHFQHDGNVNFIVPTRCT